MEVNYDDIIDQDLAPKTEQPATDMYDDMINQDLGGTESNIAANMYAAEKVDPDKSAQVLKLSKDLNLPSDIVERNYDSLSKRKAEESFQPKSIIEQNPALARFLEEPDNLKVAKDDLDSLKNIDNSLKDLSFSSKAMSALKYGAANFAGSIAKIPANMYMGGFAEPVVGEDGKLSFVEGEFKTPKELYDNKVTQFFKEKSDEYKPADIEKSFTDELSKGNIKSAGQALTLQILSNLPQVGMVVFAGPASLPLLAGASAAEKLASNLEAGVPEGEARLNAVATGTIEAVIEAVGGIGSVGFKNTIKAAAERLGNAGALDMIKNSLSTILKQGGGEGLEEAATTIAQSVLDYGMGIDDKALDGLLGKTLDSFFIGAGAGGATTATSVFAEKAQQKFQSANQAEISKNVYAAIGDSAKESKLKARMPEKLKEYIDTVADQAGVKDVYIPVEQFEQYFQSKQISPTEMATTLGVSKEFIEAKETGSDLKVPLSSMVTNLLDTEHFKGLENDIKFQPDQMTYAQSQKDVAAFKEELKKVETEAVADAGPVINYKAGAKKVGQVVREQLEALGETSRDAQKKSLVAVSFFESLGTRTKQDPFELFKKYNLEITGQTDAGEGVSYSQTLADVESQVAPLAPVKFEDVKVTRDDKLNFTATAPDGRTLFIPAARAKTFGGAQEYAQEEFNKVKPEQARVFNQSKVSNKQKAEAAGFDTGKKFFHGTKKDFSSFQIPNDGKVRTLGAGVYISENDNIPSAYGNNGKVISLFVKDTTKIINADKKIDKKSLSKIKKLLSKDILNAMELDNDFDGVTYGSFFRKLQLRTNEYNNINDTSIENNTIEIANALDIVGLNNEPRETIIFDPKNLKSVDADFNEFQSGNIYSQSNFEDIKRGTIKFGSAKVTIEMLKDADSSTYFHEMGHFYLEVLKDQATNADAPQELKDDFKTILDWFGVESADQIKTEQHEKWAEGFEKYLQEGKAPTASLRKAFAAFKAWITEAYKGLVNSQVELSDSIRSVMDRMLAADQVIQQVETDMNYEQAFTSKPEGMSDEKWARYQEAFGEARDASERYIRTRMMEDLKKRDQAFYKEKRNEIKEQVKKELQDARSYKALSILQKGKMPDGTDLPEQFAGLKINKESLKTLDKATVSNLPRGISDTEGMHVEIVAELLGYQSGYAMVESLANLKKLGAAVEQKTDEQMQELYPDYFNDPIVSQDAVTAVHNERRSEIIRIELEHIAKNNASSLSDAIKRLARKLPSSQQVKEQASKIIAGKTIQEVNPNIYKQAEIKARREAGEALAKLDYNKMFEAKRKELLNFELYRAAVTAKEDVDKALLKFRKILKKSDEDVSKTRDTDFVNAARAVLAGFGITRADKTAEQYLEKVKAYDQDTYDVLMAVINEVGSFAKPYKEVTYDQFVQMSDLVDALYDKSKTEMQFEADGQVYNKDVVTQQLSERLKSLDGDGGPGKFIGSQTTGEAIKTLFLSARAALRRVEHWTGVVDSDQKEFTRFMWRPVSDARNKYMLAKEKVIKEYRDIAKTLDKASLFKGPVKAPELGEKAFENKKMLLGAMLHTGNESNLRKLLLSEGWAKLNEDGSMDTSKWDQFTARMRSEGVLTKKDYEWLQKMWDITESLKPEAQKAHKKMFGFYFNEITAKESSVKFADGSEIVLRGGYIPAVQDKVRSSDAALRSDKEAVESGQNSYMFPTTGRGFTKSRVENYATFLSYDLDLVEMHLDKVLRFVHIEPAIKQTARLVNDKSLREDLNKYDPSVASDMLIPWLQRSASQRVSDPSGTGGAWSSADKFFNLLRNRTGMNIMAANTINVLQNYTGIWVAASKVKTKHLRNSIWNYLKSSKQMADRAATKSEFMNPRLSDQVQEIQSEVRKLYTEDTPFKTIKEYLQQNAYVLQKISQSQNNVVVWNAAYEQAIEEGKLEAEAVQLSDAAVRLTQGSMEATDVSRFETGNPFFRLFTQFYSYFNNIANLQGAEYQKIARDLGLRKGAGKLFLLFMTTLYLPAVSAEIIKRVASGQGFDADDDDEYMDDFMSVFFGAPASYFSAELPLAGPMLTLFNASWNDKHYDDRLSLSPVVSTLESMTRLPREVYDSVDNKGKENRAIRDGLTFMGVVTGVPFGALSRPLTYLNDVRNDEVEPEGIIDFTRGLVTGKSGQ